MTTGADLFPTLVHFLICHFTHWYWAWQSSKLHCCQ